MLWEVAPVNHGASLFANRTRRKAEIFARRTGTRAKHLIRLAPLPSGILFSGNFGNSRKHFARSARATLPVKQTEIKQRTPRRRDGQPRQGTGREVHAGDYTPGLL